MAEWRDNPWQEHPTVLLRLFRISPVSNTVLEGRAIHERRHSCADRRTAKKSLIDSKCRFPYPQQDFTVTIYLLALYSTSPCGRIVVFMRGIVGICKGTRLNLALTQAIDPTPLCLTLMNSQHISRPHCMMGLAAGIQLMWSEASATEVICRQLSCRLYPRLSPDPHALISRACMRGAETQ